MKINPNNLRKHVLDMVYEKQSGHIGGSVSMAELTSVLYEDNDIKGLTIAELDKLKIIGTGSSLDGSAALLTMVQSDDTRRFKTIMAIPSHITVTPT